MMLMMRDSEEVYRKVSKRRKGQLKKTREPRSRLDLAILFVQSAFPIVILLVTRCETTPFIAKTVRVPIQRISIGCGGGNRRDRRPVVAAGLDVGRARIGCSSVQICPTIGLRIPSPAPPLIALLKNSVEILLQRYFNIVFNFWKNWSIDENYRSSSFFSSSYIRKGV